MISCKQCNQVVIVGGKGRLLRCGCTVYLLSEDRKKVLEKWPEHPESYVVIDHKLSSFVSQPYIFEGE